MHDNPISTVDDPQYGQVKARLKKQMEDYQKATADRRVYGESPWDDYPFYAGTKYLKGKYLQEVQGRQRNK